MDAPQSSKFKPAVRATASQDVNAPQSSTFKSPEGVDSAPAGSQEPIKPQSAKAEGAAIDVSMSPEGTPEKPPLKKRRDEGAPRRLDFDDVEETMGLLQVASSLQ